MSEQTTASTKPQGMTKLEKNWVLYDVANSAYTLLATALLAFYFDFLSPSESLTTVSDRLHRV